MNVFALVVCGVAWVGTGVWWVFSAAGKRLIARLASRIPLRLAPLAGPAALFLAMFEAIFCAMVMVRPPFSASGRITGLGWALAVVCGVLFVTFQTVGAMVVLVKVQVPSGGERAMGETDGAPPASKPPDHESP